MMGMLDANMDGKLTKAELKGDVGEKLAKYFDMIDKNHDGFIENDELNAALQMMGNQRRRQAATPAAPSTPAEAFASGEHSSK
jgi:hypothetical protein